MVVAMWIGLRTALSLLAPQQPSGIGGKMILIQSSFQTFLQMGIHCHMLL
jgi:hypothetical protein